MNLVKSRIASLNQQMDELKGSLENQTVSLSVGLG